jgi:outer membrane protein assembly factor BamB
MSALHHFWATACILIALPYSLLAEAPSSDVWTQWRGNERNGQLELEPWPADLSDAHLTSNWVVPQGPSYSGPIVAEDRVFVTETENEQEEIVRAFARETGDLLWERRWTGAIKVPFFAASRGSWIRATPAYDGERLYVAGMRDVLVCLAADSGEVIWRVDFVAQTETPVPDFGFVSSPLVDGDFVYVQAGASLTKLNKNSGEIVWQSLKDPGGMLGGAFSSPVVATLDGHRQLVVQTRAALAGVDIEEGTVLWSTEIKAFRGMNILTPTVIGDTVFTSSYGGRSELYRIAQLQGVWQADLVWSHKSQGYMSSPVVIDGYIYLHLRNRRFLCLDAATGEEKWITRPFGQYWSMISNGNKILALEDKGDLILIEASPAEFKLIDRQTVADDAWAHVAVAGNDIYVRALGALKKFTWK